MPIIRHSESFETSDGTLFKTQSAAEDHELFLVFRKWYINHPLKVRTARKLDTEIVLVMDVRAVWKWLRFCPYIKVNIPRDEIEETPQ